MCAVGTETGPRLPAVPAATSMDFRPVGKMPAAPPEVALQRPCRSPCWRLLSPVTMATTVVTRMVMRRRTRVVMEPKVLR